jgi:hypothetical protein
MNRDEKHLRAWTIALVRESTVNGFGRHVASNPRFIRFVFYNPVAREAMRALCYDETEHPLVKIIRRARADAILVPQTAALNSSRTAGFDCCI